MRFFGKKKVPLEEQLATFAELGLVIAEGVSEADLTTSADRATLVEKPYSSLLEVLGIELEREPYTPICDRVWMCDFERIEGDGSYRDVLLRLDALSAGGLGLSAVTDHVDHAAGEAWVEFVLDGQRTRWDLEVEDDWLDPSVLSRFGALLERSGAPIRIYTVVGDRGQCALLVGLAPEHVARLRTLGKLELERL